MKEQTLLQKFLKDKDFVVELAYLDFVEELTVLMEEYGISKANLARRLNKSKPYVTKLLSGKDSNNVTLKTMVEAFMVFDRKPKITSEPLIKEAKPAKNVIYPNWRNAERSVIKIATKTKAERKLQPTGKREIKIPKVTRVKRQNLEEIVVNTKGDEFNEKISIPA